MIGYVRSGIDDGRLKPGDRLPAERDLALKVGVSRPTIRAGLRALAALGVVQSRHGSGTYIPAGPPVLDAEPLRLLSALHGFTGDELYETRRILEVAAAGLAAERAVGEHLDTIANEVTNLFAAMDAPHLFLLHDIRFHQAVAQASGNPIVASLVEMISALHYEQRRQTAERAARRDRRDAADHHRRIYQAIRARDVERARSAMNAHLLRARAYQAQEAERAVNPAHAARASTRRALR